MARRNRDHIPSITTSEILLEGPDSNTTARVSFQGNALSFQDTRTGEDLLKIDSQSREISFSNPIRLPDGTLLNTVSDVSVRDFELRASIPVIIYGADGQPKTQDEPVTITAILTGLVDQVATFTTNPSVELGGTGNIRFLYPASLADISKVDITATADEFNQTITITKVAEGSDGITVAITNPSDIISADSEGAIIQSDLLNSTGIFSLYKGSTNLTELGKVSYRVDDVVNISITIDPVTGEYQVTNFDQAATKGSATLVANYQGIEYTHTYRIVKAIAGQRGPSGLDGAAGADGTSPYIGLVTDENIFIDTVNNNNVANINTSVLDANNKLVSTLGSFEVYKGTTLLTSGVSYYLNTTGQLTTQTKNNLTFTIDPTTGEYFASVLTDVVQDEQGWNTESETFTVRAVVDGITVSTRKIKIQKTKIGKDGKTGPSLKLNVSPGLFKFNGEGVPTPNQVLTITILKSNLPDGATVQLVSEPPLMFTTTAENSTLAVENFSSDGQYLDSAVLKAQVILDEEVYLEDFVTIFRTQNGTDAKSIVLSADSQVFNFADSDSLISTTEQVSINIKTQNLTSQLTVDDIQITKNNGTTLSLSSEQLIDNQDGSYSISLSFDSLSITSKQVRDECFPIKVRVDKQGVFDIISIHKLVGGDGALSGYLTNESDQIPAFADGTTQEEDYSTLNGYFKIFKGLEEITDQCSFAVTYNENVTTTVNSVGFYSILENSISSSSNTARSVIQASYNGSEIQKVFTVTKTKQGKNTLNAIISNETHTVRAESNGNLILLNDLTTAGGVVYVYDGNDRVSSGVSYSVLLGNEEATQSGTSYTTPSGLTFSINQITGVYSLSTSTLSSWTGNTETFYIKIQYSNAEIIKSYTITKSKGGADAKLLTLRSNRMVFTFDSDNNPSPSGQEVIFTASPTKGSVPLDVPVTWSVTPSSYQSLLKDLDPVDSKKKRISIEDFKTANLQNLLITAEADALEDSITIVKAKDGSSGENAKLIKVTATSMVVAYDTNEDVTPTPETITVFITQQNLSKILEVSDIVITKSDGTTINPSSVDSSGVNSSTKTGEAFFTISLGEEQADLIRKQDLPIKIQVSSTNDNVKDTLTINKISGGKDGTDGIDGVNGIDGVDGADGADGRDAITAFLTNESHTAPAESNGFVSNDVLGDAGGSFELYDGLTKIINTENTTDKVIFSVVGGNVVSDDSVLVLEGLKIKINQSTGVYSLSNDTNTSWSRNYQVFTLRAFYNGLDFDKSYTISKSKEGQKGIDGQPGTDSKTVKLESDDYQIAYDTESKNPDPATFTLTATQQNHDNNDAIYYFYEIDQSGNENLIPKGANDADNTRIITAPADKFRAKKYKVKTKESSDGDFIATDSISVIATKDGADSVTIVVPNDNHSFPADENGTVTTADLELGSTEIEVYLGNQRLEAVDSITDGQSTVLDVNQFYVTKTESNITSSLVRTDQDPETNKYYKYFLSLSSISQDSATVALKVTLRGNTDSSKTYNKTLSYSKSRKGVDGQDGQDGAPGADGISPVNGLLSNESHTVVSTYDGTVASLNGSDGVFRVYRGQTEITSTSAVSFSVIGTQPQNGLSISIANSGANKGKYQLTQTNWTSDSESFVLQALVDGTIVVQKTYTITKSKAGANGEPAKYLILESTKQSFDKKYDNNVSVFYPDGQTITFTPAIYGFSQAPTVTWYVDGAEVTNNLFLTTGSASATMSQDQFTAATLNLTNLSTTIKATVEDDELSYSDQITVILSQQGKDGSTGRDAKTVSLVSDDYQIAYKQLGNSENWSKEPSSVTLTATGANTDAGAVIEYKFYINSQLQTRADNTSNEFVIDNFETTPDDFQKRNVKVELIEDGEVVATDTVTIFATREAKDGEAAVTISMPNSNHTFPASSLGVVDASSYSTGATEIEVYIGNTRAQPVASSTTDESMAINTFKISNVTPVNIVAGLLSNISINGFVLTTAAPNSMDTVSKTASLEFEIKVKDKFGVIKTFLQKQSFTKSERGVDGEDGLNAKALFLLSDSEAFYYNKSGGVINSQINFTTIKENISSNVTFTSNPPGLLTNIDSVNGTATLTNSNFGSNQSVTVTATVVDDKTYTDFISIKKVESGVDGSNGVDAKVVKLESNDYQIAYDKDGNNPEPASITFTATQQNHAGTVYYRFIKDGTQIQNTTSNTASINLPENKFDSPISIKVETRNVSGATGSPIAADSISIVATKDGNDSYTISIPNDNHTFVANENGVVSDYSGGGTEVQVYLGNTVLKAVSDITGSNEFKVTVVESNNITPSLVPALDNSSYTLTVGGMGTASDSATVSLAIEIRGQTEQIQTINKFLSYSKARKGAKGDDVFSGYLTNESHIVIADSDGSDYSLTTAGGTYEVFYGSQKLTSGVTYSVQGLNIKNGLTASINSSGVYSFSGTNWSSDSDIFTFRASYLVNGQTINLDKIYSITKSKAGKPSISGYLTNETHTVQTTSTGTYTTLGSAGGTFQVLKGSESATGFTFTVDQTIKNNLTASINPTTGVYSFSGTGWNADSTSFIFTATSGSAPNATVIEKTYTITKSKAGTAGAAGSSAKAVFLYSDKQAFIKNGDGQFNPSTQVISLTASLQNISVQPSWYIDDVPVTNQITVSTNKLSASINETQFSSSSQTKKITVSADGLSDTITLIATKDGAAAKAVFITSDKQTFKKDGDGTYYAGQEIKFNGREENTGEELIWSAYKIKADSTEQTLTVGNVLTNGSASSEKILTVSNYNTALSTDGTAIKIRVSVASGLFDETTIIPIQDGAEGQPGSAGVNAKSIKLTSTSYVINYNSAGKSASPSTITLTASPSSTITGSRTYSFTEGTGTSAISGTSLKQTTATATVSFSSIDYFTTPKLYKVTVYENNVEVANDSIAIAAVKEGSSARSVILSNEAHTVPVTTAGVVTYTGSGTDIEVLVGATKLTPIATAISPPLNNTFSVTSIDVTPANSITVGSRSVPYTTSILRFGEHSAMNASVDTVSITYNITAKDNEGTFFTLSKTQTITKSKQGNTGATGATGAAGAAGVDAKSVKLQSDDYQVSYNTAGKNPNGTPGFDDPIYNFSEYDTTLGKFYGWRFLNSFSSTSNYNIGYLDNAVDADITVSRAIDQGHTYGDSALLIQLNQSAATSGNYYLISDFIEIDNTKIYNFVRKVKHRSSYVGVTEIHFYNSEKSFIKMLSTPNVSANTSTSPSWTEFKTQFNGSSANGSINSVNNSINSTFPSGTKFIRLVYRFYYNSSFTVGATIYFDRLSLSPVIKLIADQQNHEGTVYYDFKEDGVSKQNTISTSYDFEPPSQRFILPKKFSVETRETSNSGTVKTSDSISIVSTKDGENAFTIAVTNENHTFVSDENGNVTDDYSGGGTDIEVYYGNTQLAAVDDSDISPLSENKFRVKVSEDTNITAGSITVSGNKSIMAKPSNMTSDTASIVLSIEVRGLGASQTFYRTLSYSKSKAGIDGADLTNIYNFSKSTTSSTTSNLKAYGWKTKFSQPASAVFENISNPLTTFPSFKDNSGDLRILENSESTNGSRTAVLNSKEHFGSTGYFYANPIEIKNINKRNFINLRYKKLKSTAESNSLVTINLFLLFAKNDGSLVEYCSDPLDVTSCKFVYHKYQLFVEGIIFNTNWKEQYFYYDSTPSQATSRTHGQASFSSLNTGYFRAGFPLGTSYVIPIIEIKSNLNDADNLFYLDYLEITDSLTQETNDNKVGVSLTKKPEEALHVGGKIKIESLETFTTGFSYAGIKNNVIGFGASDLSLKEQIVDIPQSLEKIKNIRGVYFKWKDSEEKSYGFIAQEIETTLPELVRNNPDGYKSVSYPEFTSILVEAVKELSQQIEDLKKEIQILKNK